MRTIPIQTIEQITLTECAILGLVARRERSGYDLLRTIESGVGFFWTPAKSQLYALLPKLVERGLLKARRVEQDKRPDKTLYRITAAGRRALREGLEQASPAVDRNPFELRVFFGEHMRPGAVRAMVEARLSQQREHLATLRGNRAAGRPEARPLSVSDAARGQGEREGGDPLGRAGARAARQMKVAAAIAVALVAATAAGAAYKPSSLLPLDGAYRMTDGRVVSLAVTDDGGLLYTDTRTGDLRQLRAAGPNRFTFGPAYLVQRPVRGTIVVADEAETDDRSANGHADRSPARSASRSEAPASASSAR